MAAGDLITSFTIDPANVLQGGVGSDSRLVLMLKSDIASYTLDAFDRVTAFTFNAGKGAYLIEGIRQSLKPKFQRVAADSGQSQFEHQLEFFYFAYDQVSKNNAARIAQGRYVCIIENAKQDSNVFEVYGLDVGLEIKDMSREQQAMGGAMKMILVSPPKEFEAKPPRTFDGGTGIWATNRGLVDGYLFLPTIGVSGLSITTYPAITPTAIVITGTNFFGSGTNNQVTQVALINQFDGSVIPFSATLTVTATTITTTTPATGQGAGKVYKVRVTTTRGVVLSGQTITTT